MKKNKDRKAIEKIKNDFLHENKNTIFQSNRLSSKIGYMEKNEYPQNIKIK